MGPRGRRAAECFGTQEPSRLDLRGSACWGTADACRRGLDSPEPLTLTRFDHAHVKILQCRPLRRISQVANLRVDESELKPEWGRRKRKWPQIRSVELIVQTDAHQIDADVRRDMGGDEKRWKEARFAAVFCDSIKLQMKVFRPYCPISQESSFGATACCPATWINVNAGWFWRCRWHGRSPRTSGSYAIDLCCVGAVSPRPTPGAIYEYIVDGLA